MEPLLKGKGNRPWGRRAVVAGMAGLAVVAMIGLVGLSQSVQGRGRLDELSEEDLRQMPRMDTGAMTQKMAEKFDPSAIYDDADPSTDLAHPNRIDDYGCLFSNCEDDAGAGSIINKVSSLKKQLSKFIILQRNLDEKLHDPVQTTITVSAGEPGRLGPRGARGPLGHKGRRGPRGDTGRPGFPGRPGLPGKRGVPGFQGPPGSTGAMGPQGPVGPQGEIGPRGPQGRQGKTGPQGPPGYKGDKGVEGQPGQKGNMGPKGLSPAGPEGARGPAGPKGKRGSKGKQGNRGPNGYPGNAGGTGPTGLSGAMGRPGKDAKQFKGGKCGVTESQTKDNICCGRSQVHWNTPYGIAAGITVNTQQCKFTGNVMYFPTIKGNGYQWTLGGAAIASSGQTNFVVRTSAIPSWPGHHVGRGNYANAFRWVVSWCGVGQTQVKPKNSVCCSAYNPNQHWNWWHWGGIYTYQDTSKCQFKGTPHYFYNIVADKDTYAVSGASSFYNGYRPWNKMFLIFPSFQGAYAWRDYHTQRRQKHVGLTWCGIGDTFPTGQMALGQGKITEDQYPCQGVRMMDKNQVKSNVGEVCCGLDPVGGWTNKRWGARVEWHRVPTRNGIEKRIDTSKCGFGNSVKVVWLSSLKGQHTFSVTGDAAYSQSSNKGFTKQLMGWKEDATAITAAKAEKWGWQVQWCGFGVKG